MERLVHVLGRFGWTLLGHFRINFVMCLDRLWDHFGKLLGNSGDTVGTLLNHFV